MHAHPCLQRTAAEQALKAFQEHPEAWTRVDAILEKAKAQSHELQIDYERLQLDKRAQATPARVQQLATRQLQMRPVTPGITEYVVMPVSATPSAAEPTRWRLLDASAAPEALAAQISQAVQGALATRR